MRTGIDTPHSSFVPLEQFEVKLDEDAENAFFALFSKRGQGVIKYTASFILMSRIHHALTVVMQQMIMSRRLAPDRGRSAVADVIAQAVRPAKSQVIRDPETGDVVLAMQFYDGGPLAVRFTQAEANALHIEREQQTHAMCH